MGGSTHPPAIFAVRSSMPPTTGLARCRESPSRGVPPKSSRPIFTRNNGITEGFHNKVETINRQAYGFRNFEHYRQREQVLCA
jgi:hypothetical protein